jgi:hypothetical protein
VGSGRYRSENTGGGGGGENNQERKIKSGKSRAGPAPKPEGKASHQKEKGNWAQEKRRGKIKREV